MVSGNVARILVATGSCAHDPRVIHGRSVSPLSRTLEAGAVPIAILRGSMR